MLSINGKQRTAHLHCLRPCPSPLHLWLMIESSRHLSHALCPSSHHHPLLLIRASFPAWMCCFQRQSEPLLLKLFHELPLLLQQRQTSQCPSRLSGSCDPDDDPVLGIYKGLPRPAPLVIFHRAKGGKEHPSGFDISSNCDSNDVALWFIGHPLTLFVLSLLLGKYIFNINPMGHCVR